MIFSSRRFAVWIVGGGLVGFGLAKEGKLLNRLPRWIIQKS